MGCRRTPLRDPLSDLACRSRPCSHGGSLTSNALHDLAIGGIPGCSPSEDGRVSGPIVLDLRRVFFTCCFSIGVISSGSAWTTVGTGGASSRSRKLSPASDPYLPLLSGCPTLLPRFPGARERVRVRALRWRLAAEVEATLWLELATESARANGWGRGREGSTRAVEETMDARRCLRRRR